MKLRELQLPKASNVDFLLRFLSERKLMAVIGEMADKPAEQRRIILPSRSCMRKCLIYFLVKKHKGNFSKVLDVLRDNGSVLALDGHYINNIKRLYKQKEKELESEK